MERVVVNWVVICVFIFLFEFISSASQHDFQHHHVDNQTNTHGKPTNGPHTWRSPKLGREKRNSNSNDYCENIQKEKLVMLIMDAPRDAPWSKENGRDSGAEEVDGMRSDENQWSSDNSAMSEKFFYQRSPPFAPRLGRHL